MERIRLGDLPSLDPRPASSHKGSFGKLLVAGGSTGFTGAVCLAASAALRSGAGLVTVAVPKSLVTAVTAVQPCAMTLPLPESKDGKPGAGSTRRILDFLAGCDGFLLGPGLGRGREMEEMVADLMRASPCPTVLDADGLNNLSARIDTLADVRAPSILTPHPGEMARLDPTCADRLKSDRAGVAAEFASRWKCIVVLKGFETVVTDGRRLYVNRSGNPGMATGGTGDVLGGVLAALLGLGLPHFPAAALATHVHGVAGDLAAAQLGEIGMIASDLLDFLPTAFRMYQSNPDRSARRS